LIFHQRDQRRDDDADAVAKQRRDLVTQRLAAARRHQHEGVAAFERGADRLLLAVAERAIAEGLAQQAPCVLEGRHKGLQCGSGVK
jgi:hypothetical protein